MSCKYSPLCLKWPLTMHLRGVTWYTITSLIARFMGPTWGPSWADRTQVGPMLAPWTLLSTSHNSPQVYIMPIMIFILSSLTYFHFNIHHIFSRSSPGTHNSPENQHPNPSYPHPPLLADLTDNQWISCVKGTKINGCQHYCQISYIRCILVSNKNHSDLAGTLPISTAPTTSSFST